MEILAQNTNDLQNAAYEMLLEKGVPNSSRNGNVLVMPEPVTICFEKPLEKVNFSRVRDANPFFHLMESMVMLAGINNVNLLSVFAKNMENFSDNGYTYNAFYGERLRRKWGDQLNAVIEELRKDPNTRQAVCQLWDPADLQKTTKDKACNMQIIFSIVDQKVRMTTINRSNDAIWGFVNGANVVHFAYFLEYVCCSLGLSAEKWFHFSNNFHVYTDNPKWEALSELGDFPSYYPCTQRPLFSHPAQKELFDKEITDFVMRGYDACNKESGIPAFPVTYGSSFIQHTCVPVVQLYRSYLNHNRRKFDVVHLDAIKSTDWKIACRNWLESRINK